MPSYDEKIAAGRKPCQIPGCRRTFKPGDYNELICGEHWRLAPLARRKVYARVRKAWEVASVEYARFAAISDTHPDEHAEAAGKFVALESRCDRLWERIKQQIIERVVGL